MPKKSYTCAHSIHNHFLSCKSSYITLSDNLHKMDLTFCIIITFQIIVYSRYAIEKMISTNTELSREEQLLEEKTSSEEESPEEESSAEESTAEESSAEESSAEESSPKESSTEESSSERESSAGGTSSDEEAVIEEKSLDGELPKKNTKSIPGLIHFSGVYVYSSSIPPVEWFSALKQVGFFKTNVDHFSRQMKNRDFCKISF